MKYVDRGKQTGDDNNTITNEIIINALEVATSSGGVLENWGFRVMREQFSLYKCLEVLERTFESAGKNSPSVKL